MSASPSRLRSHLVRPTAIVGLLMLLTGYAFREVLTERVGRLPGLDAPISYAWEVHTRSALSMAQWPHWNPHAFAGTPHFADTLTASIYPPAVMLRWMEPSLFLRAMMLLHLVIGGAGTLLLARVVGLGWWAATAAAIAVTLGGTAASAMYLGHVVVVYVTPWLPWALAFAILSARRPGVLPHPGLPIVLAVQFLAGYLQGTIYITAVVSLYLLFCAAWPERLGSTAGVSHPSSVARWRPLAQLAVLGLLTFGLTAVQLYPFVELALQTARTDGLPYEAAVAEAWAFRDLATFFWPFTGLGSEPVYRFLNVAYVGWPLACALPFAWFDTNRRRTVVFLTLLAVVSFAFAFGDALPFYRLHHAVFPGLRVPARFLFIVALCVAVLGAIGMEQLAVLIRERQWKRFASGALITALLVLSASAIMTGNGATDAVRAVHLWPWPPVLASAAFVAAVVMSARWRRWALVPLVVATAVDVTVFAHGGSHTVPIESAETIRQRLGPLVAHGRVWSLCPGQIGSNELVVAGRPTLDGPIGVTLRDFQDWQSVLYNATWPADTLGPLRIRRDLLDMANVTNVVACEPIDAPGLTLVRRERDLFVYRNDRAWARAVWTCGAETVTRARAEQQRRSARYEDGRRLVPLTRIYVHWNGAVGEDQRRALEDRYSLRDGSVSDEGTWRYRLYDPSPENVRALVNDRLVDDTHGVDRGSGRITEEALGVDEGGPDQMLIGTRSCAAAANVSVRVTDQPDGHVAVDVDTPADGVVFLSEPRFPGREAFVDGKRVDIHGAMLAFTAIAVPAGRHLVELRLVPRTLYWGAATTIATIAGWIGVALNSRRARRSKPRMPNANTV